MISQLNISQQNISYKNKSSLKDKGNDSPNFGRCATATLKKGGKLLSLVQTCEKEPMVNVAVIDLVTAIIPRTLWDLCRNIFAGLEALRREASGLIVNCLIPGFITLGFAHLFNKMIMGKGKANLANCWASSDTINNVSEHYKNAKNTEAYKDGMKIFKNDKHATMYAVNRNLLEEANGIDGFDKKSFGQILSKQELSDYAEKLTRVSFKSENGKLTEEVIEKTPKKRLKAIYRSITRKTHIAQDVKFGDKMVSKLNRALTDTHQLVKGMIKEGITPETTADFVKRSKRLLKTKSLLGMLTILPLAASMQYINRKITEKTSGVKGAPIHEDYGKKEEQIHKTPEQIKSEKQQLFIHKIGAVASMFGLAMLSMLKLPNMTTLKNIVQFKDQFPTMDQARAISAITFGSRMAVADDSAELKEHHTRDMITFGSMYFLGDYGAKGAASYLEHKHGIELLNKTYDKNNNKGFLKKAKNWVLHTHLKSSDELKGTGEVLEKAIRLRSKAQVANLGTSLALLGVVVPLYTMFRTKKHDAAEKAKLLAAKNNTQSNNTLTFASSNFAGTKFNSTNGISSRGINQQQAFPALKKFRTKVEVAQ